VHLAEFMEEEQLERDPIMTAPGLVKFGLDAQLSADGKVTRLMRARAATHDWP
jgi:hypothetical protein